MAPSVPDRSGDDTVAQDKAEVADLLSHDLFTEIELRHIEKIFGPSEPAESYAKNAEHADKCRLATEAQKEMNESEARFGHQGLEKWFVLSKMTGRLWRLSPFDIVSSAYGLRWWPRKGWEKSEVRNTVWPHEFSEALMRLVANDFWEYNGIHELRLTIQFAVACREGMGPRDSQGLMSTAFLKNKCVLFSKFDEAAIKDGLSLQVAMENLMRNHDRYRHREGVHRNTLLLAEIAKQVQCQAPNSWSEEEKKARSEFGWWCWGVETCDIKAVIKAIDAVRVPFMHKMRAETHYQVVNAALQKGRYARAISKKDAGYLYQRSLAKDLEECVARVLWTSWKAKNILDQLDQREAGGAMAIGNIHESEVRVDDQSDDCNGDIEDFDDNEDFDDHCEDRGQNLGIYRKETLIARRMGRNPKGRV